MEVCNSSSGMWLSPLAAAISSAVRSIRPAKRGMPFEAWRSSSKPESDSKVWVQPALLRAWLMSWAKRSRSGMGLSCRRVWMRPSRAVSFRQGCVT